MSVTAGSVVAIAAVAFVALWLVITFVLSFAAGWNGLAARYRSELPFTGRTWSMRSGRMGVVRYNGVLTVGVNPAGMYLAMLPLFRLAHPPLFVPWSDITVSSARRFLADFIVFEFRQAPGTSLWLFDRFGREVLETAQAR